MKDFLSKYHKRKIIGNIFMVFGALILAIGINFFLIDESDFGKNLKTSILEAGIKEEKADLFLEKNDGKINLKNNKKIKNMDNFSVSLSYNPEIINISKIKSNLGEISILGDKSDGIINVILSTKGETLNPNKNILEMSIEKKENKSSGLNLINANFSDTNGEKYEFTTSGIIF